MVMGKQVNILLKILIALAYISKLCIHFSYNLMHFSFNILNYKTEFIEFRCTK